MATNQSLVLRALYWGEKSMNPKEISRESGLKHRQVLRALHDLKKMGYIKTTFIPIHFINGEMINNQTSSVLASARLTENNLKKKGLI